MLRSLLFGLACVSVTTGLHVSRGAEVSAKAKAHVFVMNADKKIGRCRCASGQLAETNVPYSASRILAATPDDAQERCHKVKHVMSTPHGGAEAALFCSNYLAWKEALDKHGDKDYIIIFEDDVFLKGENFWQRVDDFLASNCTAWDHITVDPYVHSGPAMKARQDCPGYTLKKPCLFCGAHMQILRRSTLESIVNHAEKHGSYIMDDVQQWMPPHTTKLVWKAEIVQQWAAPAMPKIRKDRLPQYCDGEVYKHTVTTPGSQIFGAFGGLFGLKDKESEMFAFQCPSKRRDDDDDEDAF